MCWRDKDLAITCRSDRQHTGLLWPLQIPWRVVLGNARFSDNRQGRYRLCWFKERPLARRIGHPGTTPVQDRERSLPVALQHMPRLHLHPRQAMCVVCASLFGTDCVGTPNLDQQQRSARSSAGNFEVRHVAPTAGDHRALDFDDDCQKSQAAGSARFGRA